MNHHGSSQITKNQCYTNDQNDQSFQSETSSNLILNHMLKKYPRNQKPFHHKLNQKHNNEIRNITNKIYPCVLQRWACDEKLF